MSKFASISPFIDQTVKLQPEVSAPLVEPLKLKGLPKSSERSAKKMNPNLKKDSPNSPSAQPVPYQQPNKISGLGIPLKDSLNT